MTEFIVAIDGPAGSGKSTIAKQVAKEFSFTYIDTGAMYRMLALKILNNNIFLNDNDQIEKILKETKLGLKNDKFYLDGKDVSELIRTREVSELTSKVAEISILRKKLVKWQQEIAKGQRSILDGRDIGTVVFPNADIKIYLNASVEERARRRLNEYKRTDIKLSEVIREIEARDKNDMEREDSPLMKAEDSIEIDTTTKTLDEVIVLVSEMIEKKIIAEVMEE